MFAVCMSGSLSAAQCALRPARAANPPVDAELLEFLGSVDSEDADWNQYRADSAGAANPSNARPVRAQVQPDARAVNDPPANPSTAGSGSGSTRAVRAGTAASANGADGSGNGSAGAQSSGPAKRPAAAQDKAAAGSVTGPTRVSSPSAAADEPLPNSEGQAPPPGASQS